MFVLLYDILCKCYSFLHKNVKKERKKEIIFVYNTGELHTINNNFLLTLKILRQEYQGAPKVNYEPLVFMIYCMLPDERQI